jgi:hypothetical protein
MKISNIDELAALRAADGSISVVGDLTISGTQITALPEGLSVGGGLDLSGTQITALPEGLSVGGGLYMSGTQITALPEGLSVVGGLDLDPKQCSFAGYKENCGELERTIWSVWMNGQPYIRAGCFWGTQQEFCDAVDKKYSGISGEKYKADAQECVDQLVAAAG